MLCFFIHIEMISAPGFKFMPAIVVVVFERGGELIAHGVDYFDGENVKIFGL